MFGIEIRSTNLNKIYTFYSFSLITRNLNSKIRNYFVFEQNCKVIKNNNKSNNNDHKCWLILKNFGLLSSVLDFNFTEEDHFFVNCFLVLNQLIDRFLKC
ncbi:hypothetical protein BpHYR1_005350 [Brachionus plicatilis]|uniref:Uncharacterized protein n=1 Tax=Brachionus plicatilis TaxID=10195 RepID=A0A3M7R452_BRAPC|nr:hypothetical protein BpHYR1_005350 [Brachionus plicatilis]